MTRADVVSVAFSAKSLRGVTEFMKLFVTSISAAVQYLPSAEQTIKKTFTLHPFGTTVCPKRPTTQPCFLEITFIY